jgi:hypothetical protein
MPALPGFCFLLKHLAEKAGMGQEPAVGELFNDGERRGATRRVASEGTAESARARCVHDFGAAGDGGYRQASAQGFGGEDEVRLKAEVGAGEEFAGASEAGLHFVGDEYDTVIATDGCERGKEALGRDDEASFAQNGLGDDRGDVFGCNHAAECVVEQCFYVGLCDWSAMA